MRLIIELIKGTRTREKIAREIRTSIKVWPRQEDFILLYLGPVKSNKTFKAERNGGPEAF